MRLASFAVWGIVCATSAMACNALLGLDELTAYEADEAGISSSSSGETGLPESGPTPPDATSSSGGSSSGGTEGDAGVAPCDPNEVPNVEGAVFVKSGATGDGRMNNPLGSVAAAIDRLTELYGADSGSAPSDASSLVPTIYVYAGSFSETRTLIVQGLPAFHIDGAWVGALTQWTRDCSPYRRGNTVVNAIGARGLVIHDVPGTSTISNLSLFTGVSGNDNSRIGVQAIDSGPLTISNANVVAENGARGSDATAGTTATQTCGTIAPESCKAQPQAGAMGDEGGAGEDGSFSRAGFTPGHGHDGRDGNRGEHSRGTAPQSGSCVVTCPEPANDATQCEAPTPTTVFADEAGCGCGGAQGTGGQGGRGGGASVAVLTNGTLNAEYSILQAKNGGNGLPGANGGTGAAGTPGAIGSDVQCSPPGAGCCLQDDGSGTNTCVPAKEGIDPLCYVAPTVLKGGLPTSGAAGGNGGRGGNGAGGPSYTVVLLPGGSASYKDINRSFGVGGAGVAPAPNGKSAFELRLEP